MKTSLTAQQTCKLCCKPIHSQGLCSTHYPRLKRRGDPHVAAPHERSDDDAVYQFIERFIARHGYAPTNREIAEGCGLRSGVLARAVVRRLARQKRLAVVGRAARGIVLAAEHRPRGAAAPPILEPARRRRSASSSCRLCDRTVEAREFCKRHYARLRRSGRVAQMRHAESEYNKERVYAFVKAFWAREGRAPSVRQIGNACGWRSEAPVKKYLLLLAKERRLHYVSRLVGAIALR